MSSQQRSFWGGSNDTPPPPPQPATTMHPPPPQQQQQKPPAGGAGRAPGPPPPPPPPCPVKSLTQFGSLARDVLLGNKAEGLFGVPGAAKLSISSTTSAGVSITTTATSNTAGSKPPAGQVLAAYAAPDGAWLGDVLLSSGGIAELTVSRGFTLPASLYTSPRDRDRDGSDSGSGSSSGSGGGSSTKLRPPLKPGRVVVGGVVSLPGLSSREQALPPKVTLDYAGTYWHAKTATSLPLAPGGGMGRPSLTASAVTGAGRLALGADVSLSVTGGGGGGSSSGAAGGAAGGGVGSSSGGGGGAGVRLTRWGAAAAWHDERQHVALQLLQSGKTASLWYGYCLQPGVTLGVSAEADVSGVRLAPAPATAAPATAAPATAGGAAATATAVEGGAAGRRAFMPPPTFAVGASFRLPAAASSNGGKSGSSSGNGSGSSSGGGVVKVKAASDGTVSVLYRDVTATGQRLTLTAQLDALDLTKSPRLGMSVDV